MKKSIRKSSKDSLHDELIKAEKNGKALIAKGRKEIQAGQFTVDIARATLGLVDYFPEAVAVESILPIWKNVNNTHFLALSKETDLSINASSSSIGTTVTSVFSSSVDAEKVIPFLPPERQGPARLVMNTFMEITDNPLYKEEAQLLLFEWGFDKAPNGQKSALEHITTAFDAYENPVSDTNPTMTSLIPMRECINTVIKGLLRRRPVQEKASTNKRKILSIGTQLKADSVSDDTISELASQFDTLIDNLSTAKEASISRDDWRRRLNQATFFLNSLLRSLDMSKGKKTKRE